MQTACPLCYLKYVQIVPVQLTESVFQDSFHTHPPLFKAGILLHMSTSPFFRSLSYLSPDIIYYCSNIIWGSWVDLKTEASVVLPTELSDLTNPKFISLSFRKSEALSKHCNVTILIFCIMQITSRGIYGSKTHGFFL